MIAEHFMQGMQQEAPPVVDKIKHFAEDIKDEWLRVPAVSKMVDSFQRFTDDSHIEKVKDEKRRFHSKIMKGFNNMRDKVLHTFDFESDSDSSSDSSSSSSSDFDEPQMRHHRRRGRRQQREEDFDAEERESWWSRIRHGDWGHPDSETATVWVSSDPVEGDKAELDINFEWQVDFKSIPERFLALKEKFMASKLYHRLEPYFAQARELALEYSRLHASLASKLYLQAPDFIQGKYREFCEGAPEINSREEWQAQFQTDPVHAVLCNERAETLVNYVAFLSMVPAIKALHGHKLLLKLLGEPEADELMNDIEDEALAYVYDLQ